MTAVSSILNADMATIGRLLQNGLEWWLRELRALAPRSFTGSRNTTVEFDGVAFVGEVKSRKVAVRLQPPLVLLRRIERPLMSDSEVTRMLAFDRHRILPLPEDQMLAGFRVRGRDSQAGRMSIEIGGLACEVGERLANALADAGAIPAEVVLPSSSGGIDFLPAMKSAGILRGLSEARRVWWVIALALFALNLGLLIWRDAGSVARLRDQVEAQQPGVLAAQRIAKQLERTERLASVADKQRLTRDPLPLLAELSRALPGDVFVQRLTAQAGTIRITGFKARSTNIVSILRGVPGFSDVRAASADTLAEVPIGEPFDVSAHWRGAL
jgi:hypothetical protein